MAHIVLQFGQCGNQLGKELFSLALNDVANSSYSYWNNTCFRDSWFCHTSKNELKARAVMVDSNNILTSDVSSTKNQAPWTYCSGNLLSSYKGGAGNNFAFGYSVTGPDLKDHMMEVLRKECEKCDRVRGIIGLGSCGGGTGSGTGTFLLEQINDSYSSKNIISVLVTPYSSGEVVIQNNNMLFAISKQNDICDALVIVENDLISNFLKNYYRLKNFTFFDVNRLISMNILSFLQPMKIKNNFIDFYDLLSSLCFHPSYKLLSVQSFPLLKQSNNKHDTSPSWNTIERDLIKYLKTSSFSSGVDFVNCVSTVVFSRGQVIPNSTLSKVKSAFLPADWVPPNFAFHYFHNPRQFINQEKCLTVVSNSSKVCGFLDSYISKSWKLFSNNMHVHHYYKFGLTKDDFMDAFVKSEKILKAYSCLQ